MSLSDSTSAKRRRCKLAKKRTGASAAGCLAKQDPNEKHAFESQRMQTDLQVSYERYHSLVFSLTTRSLSNVRLVAPEVTGLQTLPGEPHPLHAAAPASRAFEMF